MGNVVYLMKSGTLARRNHTLHFTTAEGARAIPVKTTAEIHAFGEITCNKRVLEFLSAHGIPLHFYTYHGHYAGSYVPEESSGAGAVTLQQAKHCLEPAKRLILARTFVVGAVTNMQRVLQYYQRRGKDLGDAIALLAYTTEQTGTAHTVEVLQALEGRARQTYYQAWNRVLARPELIFATRSRRPPRDPLNALVSFGNTLLYVATLSQIFQTRLDPRLSFLHTPSDRRYSLHLDVSEVFKPIIVDRTIFSLINRRILQVGHFAMTEGGVFLNEEGRRLFLEAFEDHMRKTVRTARLGHRLSYRSLIRAELRKIERHVLDEEPYHPYIL
jgi:CRISPR-associated protein Cas1